MPDKMPIAEKNRRRQRRREREERLENETAISTKLRR